MTTRRTLYILSAAAMLLGAAPALADAGSEAAHAGCPCAKNAAPKRASERHASGPAAQGDEAFLQRVWSAP